MPARHRFLLRGEHQRRLQGASIPNSAGPAFNKGITNSSEQYDDAYDVRIDDGVRRILDRCLESSGRGSCAGALL